MNQPAFRTTSSLNSESPLRGPGGVGWGEASSMPLLSEGIASRANAADSSSSASTSLFERRCALYSLICCPLIVSCLIGGIVLTVLSKYNCQDQLRLEENTDNCKNFGVAELALWLAAGVAVVCYLYLLCCCKYPLKDPPLIPRPGLHYGAPTYYMKKFLGEKPQDLHENGFEFVQDPSIRSKPEGYPNVPEFLYHTKDKHESIGSIPEPYPKMSELSNRTEREQKNLFEQYCMEMGKDRLRHLKDWRSEDLYKYELWLKTRGEVLF